MINRSQTSQVYDRAAVMSARYKLPAMVMCGMLLSVAYLIAVPIRQLYQVQPPVAEVSASQVALGHLSYQPGQLFGLYQQKGQDVPLTQLSLKLQGVGVTTSGGQGGWAVIASDNGKVAGYRVGDRLPGGAILAAVQSRQVVLNHNGRKERLQMKIPVLAGLASQAK